MRALALAISSVLVLGCHAAARGAPDAGSPEEEPPLPGIEHPSPVLAEKLRAALRERGPGYAPRAHHRAPDGSPRYVNRLILESSPYLLQHAHNPVDWYPWGDAAFARARREGRPVLVSIGYSTCHWCHVMEAETFEDEEIAAYLNQRYVCIKVDREERPDVDAAYLDAVQRLGVGGGWPLNVWLTPERQPFFGGTYFPARDGDRGARKGFLTLARELEGRFRAAPLQVASQAASLAAQVRTDLDGEGGQAVPGEAELAAASAYYAGRFDRENGGLTGAPKFPSSLPVRLLLRRWRRTGSARELEMATRTLERMAAGGLYDQVGGGFHRYATDARWRVPHFEKMLYDNALLAIDYAEAFLATHRPDFARVLRETLAYLARDLRCPEGGFYAATDADSAEGEGAFFTWTAAELEATLGPAAARFERFYGVTREGSFAGRNILFVPAPDEAEWGALGDTRRSLLAARALRPPPARDEKLLAAWNGLAISALARGGRALGEPGWVELASQAGRFALARLVGPDGPRRVAGGVAAGYLEDGAALTGGFLDLFEATGDPAWLEAARRVQASLDARYADPTRGGYFRTAVDAPAPLGRERPSQDGAEPSGNSLEALNLLRLAELTGDARYRQTAEMLLRGFGPVLADRPAALPEMLLAVDFFTDTPKEIAIVRPDGAAPGGPLEETLRGRYLPNDVLWAGPLAAVAGAARAAPWLEGKRPLQGKTAAYVCTQGRCELPTTTAEAFRRQLGGRAP